MKRPLGSDDDAVGTAKDDYAEGGHDTSDLKVSKKKKSKASDMGHEFSSREISKLQETEATFHSSLFKLQVNEILKEISVKQKLRLRVTNAAETLIRILKKLPEGKEHQISETQWLDKKGVKMPFWEKLQQVAGTFQFSPPKDVVLSGSTALDSAVKPNVEADLILVIPKESFHPKDYVNQRCLRKQALYLAAVASHLKKKKKVENLAFSYHHGNPLKPVLHVSCRGDDGKSCKLCLHTAVEPDTFKLSRFHVSKNNVRPKWFDEKPEDTSAEDDPSSLPATPFYSLSMLQSMCCLENDRLMERLLKGSESVTHAVMLLKVWLKQRELSHGFGSFTNYMMTAVVAFLLIKKKLNKLMNSYQVFRTTLLYLSRADWSAEPPSLCEDHPGKTAPSLEEFQTASQCVFVDRTGFFNLAYTLGASTLKMVSKDAKLTIESLDSSAQRNFDATFMTHLTFPRKFDYLFHVKMDPKTLEAASGCIDDLSTSTMDFGGHQSLALQAPVEAILAGALKDRAFHVQSQLADPPSWDVSDSPYSYDSRTHITIGLSLNPASAFNALDKGPLADVPEAKEFREFWGGKSEMRRFKDGTIHEAVLWSDSSNQCDRRLICGKIVAHVLNRHCCIPESAISFMGGKLDSLLGHRGEAHGTGEEDSLAVLRAFDDVNRALRALDSLPLSIHSVQGIHPVFRHADVFPPSACVYEGDGKKTVFCHEIPEEGKHLPPYTPALTVLCMLEGSGKWPEHKEAMDCMKALLHIKTGEELRDKHHMTVSTHASHVDIIKEGFVFRLKLANTRELAVLKTVKTDSGMVKFRDTEESQTLEKEIVGRPLHTHLLHGIQQEHPVFSATVRLCKRWLAAQMVWDFMEPEALELMVASIFISPHPYTAPGSPFTGLLRFLHLLSSYNWDTDPLMVNLNKEFTESDQVNLPKEFRKNRATLPSMGIMTPQDKQGSRWTRPQPSAPLLQRLVLLARQSLQVLESQVLDQTSQPDFKQVFRPSLQHFDHTIKILKKANVLRYQNVASKTEPPQLSGELAKKRGKMPTAFPITEFNPCSKFFHNLKEMFGDLAMFFYDPFGGDVIGMVWKQQALEKKDFKPSMFSHRHPVLDENEQVTLDIKKDAVLDEIRVIGGGVVESILAPNANDK